MIQALFAVGVGLEAIAMMTGNHALHRLSLRAEPGFTVVEVEDGGRGFEPCDAEACTGSHSGPRTDSWAGAQKGQLRRGSNGPTSRPLEESGCPKAMFLKSVTELPRDFDEVRAAMLHRPNEWLDDLASAAGVAGDHLMVEVGLDVRGHQFRRRARIDVGEAVSTDRVTSLPLRLQVEDYERLFPALDGSLDAAWLGPGRTHLALTAQYEPPFGAVGRAVDRALLHRVAEAVAQRFLEAIAERLVAWPAPDRRGRGGLARVEPTQ